MRASPTPIPGLLLLELKVHRDDRGFFTERYQEKDFQAAGITERFVQDNHSRSAPGVLRGLHFQPGQGKLVGAIRGRIWDVAVDLRPGSAAYGKHYGVELSDENGLLLWVPAGFAHGFCVIGQDPADVLYKVTALYDPKTEKGLRWNDPELKISWPHAKPQVSARDAALPAWSEIRGSKA